MFVFVQYQSDAYDNGTVVGAPVGAGLRVSDAAGTAL